MAVKIQLRRDVASAWTAANPTLAEGEIGLETDTTFYKIGTGSTAWTSLAYGSITGTLANDSVTTAKILNANVTAAKLASDAVTTVKIQDLAVTGVKQANFTVSTKTASYTLVAADRHTRIVMNVGSANTVTVNTSLFSAGDTLELSNIGAGISTVTAGTATVSSAGPLAIPQYGSGTLYFTSAGVAIFFPSAVTASAGALTLVGSATLSSTSTKITSVFSATYDNYLISISDMKLSASAGYIGFNLLSGSTSITTGYNAYYIYYKASVQTGGEDASSAKWSEPINQSSASNSVAGQFQILQPFLATSTWFNASNQIPANFGRTYNGENSNATSYDGIELTQTNGFASGKVRIYGYALT